MSKETNLLDSLCIITSDNLLKDLMGVLAPDFTYDWEATENDLFERSAAIEKGLHSFKRRHPNQHCNLNTNLSTIALINAAENGAYLQSQIHANPFLKNRITEYDFGLRAEPNLTSNLAAWLLLQTLIITPDTLEHDRTKKLWDEVVTIATKRDSKVRYERYSIYEPTVNEETDWDKNVNAKYLDYLRVLLLPRSINPNQPVPVGYIRQQEDYCFQFLFKIPKYPKLSSQVRQDGEGYESRRDMNADSIEIRFYPNINRIRVSDEPDVNTKEIAKHFAIDVLGTRIDETGNNKVYTSILAQFRSKDHIASLRSTMTQAAMEAEAKVWIEEMDFSYGPVMPNKASKQATFEEITPDTARDRDFKEFPPMSISECDIDNDVYEVLERAFKDEFTADKRTIHRIKLMVKLRNPINWSIARDQQPESDFATYPITITDTKRNVNLPPETPREHKKIIDDLLREWKLIGAPKPKSIRSRK